MNRLEASPSPATTPAKEFANEFSEAGREPGHSGALTGQPESSGGQCDAATFVPVHYESGYEYPLLVWLHDAGHSQHDLPAIMANLSNRNYLAVAPGACGAAPWPETAAGIADSEARIVEAIEHAAEQYSVHTGRVFIAGAGAGGTAALRVALANPAWFAGAASFDGPLPVGHNPLRQINQLRELPLLLSIGGESRRYPQAQACRDLRLLHTAGLTVHLRHEPGDGDLTTTMLAELDRWMMDIVCGSQTAAC